MSARVPLKVLIAAGIRRYVQLIGMNLLPTSGLRCMLLKACGVKIGKGCYIGFNVCADTNYPELIHIGQNVVIAQGSMLITHTQSPVESNLSRIYDKVAGIAIEDGAWIGSRCLILPGAHIGKHCFIGAGSVVRGRTKDFSLYAGNPCRFVKDLRELSINK